MRNMKTIVTNHNKKILNGKDETETTKCNCQQKASCPLKGNCLSTNTLYAGKISSNLQNYRCKEYVGLSAPPWKLRYGNHKLSFSKKEYAKCEIAKEVWKIKDQGGEYGIDWNIIGHAPAYNQATKKCHLCTSEKLHIAEKMDDKNTNLLNKRDELISRCLHQNRYALSRYKPPD